jgi:FkbM family methyltransferase
LVRLLAHVPTARDRVKLLALYAELTRRDAFGQAGPRRSVRIRFGDRIREWHLTDVGELWALAEVVVSSHYGGPHLPAQASVVVDVGANVGAATAWFRARFPTAVIVAVEPDPETFASLEKNVGDDPQIRLVHGAVADRDGELFLTREGMSVLTRVSETASESAVRVRCFSLSSLMQHVGIDAPIDLLKIDAEGGEWKILENPLPDVATIVMEVHEFDGGGSADSRLRPVADRERMTVSLGSASDIRWLTSKPV